MQACFALHARDMRFKPLFRLEVDDGPDLVCDVARIADRKLVRRTRYHFDHAVGNVILDEQ
jgi:hypothetical protein